MEGADLLESLASLLRVLSDAINSCCVEEHDGPCTAQTVWELVDLGAWESAYGVSGF